MRRSWWELQKGSKDYVEKHHKKWELLKLDNFHLALEILKLPRGFTCYKYHKDLTIEERMRFVLIASLTRDPGPFEYEMLEIDRTLLRRAH
jgi:hypothetical protein